MSDKNTPELTADESALINAFRSGNRADIVALTGKLLLKQEQPTTRTPEQMALDMVAAMETGDSDATAGALAALFKHYYPPSQSAEPMEAPAPESTPKPYRGTHYSLGTSSTAHKGTSELAKDSDYLRRAWYIVGVLVEASFVNFEHEKPGWEQELELLLIVVSQAIKQTEY